MDGWMDAHLVPSGHIISKRGFGQNSTGASLGGTRPTLDGSGALPWATFAVPENSVFEAKPPPAAAAPAPRLTMGEARSFY